MEEMAVFWRIGIYKKRLEEKHVPAEALVF